LLPVPLGLSFKLSKRLQPLHNPGHINAKINQVSDFVDTDVLIFMKSSNIFLNIVVIVCGVTASIEQLNPWPKL